jgi:hypothetical protein
MPVLHPRTRLVYFRVSEEEFQQLNEMCQSSGARSISELARQAIRKVLDRPESADGVAHEGDLAGRIDKLTTLVENLEERLVNGGAKSADGSV